MLESVKNTAYITIPIVLLNKLTQIYRFLLVVIFTLEETCMGKSLHYFEFWEFVLS